MNCMLDRFSIFWCIYVEDRKNEELECLSIARNGIH